MHVERGMFRDVYVLCDDIDDCVLCLALLAEKRIGDGIVECLVFK
jgi:hypothetical protein